MSEFRRQKRRAIREGKKNLTTTKIDDNLAAALDGYLTNKHWFLKQLDLCDELGLEFPKKAKTGYELPLFNKNPLTNEIEIHAKSAELFTAYQLTIFLADGAVGLDDESEEYLLLAVFLGAIDRSPSFATYLSDLINIGKEKGKDPFDVIVDNIEEIDKKLQEIVAGIK